MKTRPITNIRISHQSGECLKRTYVVITRSNDWKCNQYYNITEPSRMRVQRMVNRLPAPSVWVGETAINVWYNIN